MFERLQRPFLTVETGEAYQPIRLSYELHQKDRVIQALDHAKCLEKNNQSNSWQWYWREECNGLHFESVDSYVKNEERPLRLGTITLFNEQLYLSLPSFKRACLAVPFFHQLLSEATTIHHADFINKVYGLDERLPHGFTELFKDDELEKIIKQRTESYEKVQAKCEEAETAEEALTLLSEYTKIEAQKKLPYAERYAFQASPDSDPDVVFLGFYIFLRGREMVAIRRWFGETGFSLNDAADETIEQVFGGMDIDILE